MTPRFRCTLQQLRHLTRPRHRYCSSSNNGSSNNSSNRSSSNNHSSNTNNSNYKENPNESSAYKLGAIVVFVFGLSYASVPLYKVFCQVTGFGGTTQRVNDLQKKINSKIGDATASIGSVTNAATSALNSKIANATASLNITKKKGGYRKTAKFHRKNKS